MIAAAVLVLGPAHAAAAARLPAQVWAISLSQPVSANVLATAKHDGINALLVDRAAVGAAARTSLRRNAAAARLTVYEPARDRVCRAHPCLLYAPTAGALASLARVPGVDALVVRLASPASLAQLVLPPRVHVIALLRSANAAAIGVAAARARLDLAVAPAGPAALKAFLGVLADRGAPEPQPPPPPVLPPGAPTALSPVVASQAVVLSWTASAGAVGYEVSVDGGTPQTLTGTTVTFSGLTCGRAYAFAVTAVGADGQRSAPATTSATPGPCSGGGGGPPPPPAPAPSVVVSGSPATLTNQTTATFSFSSLTATRFECALDGGAFSGCTSPAAYTALTQGSHTFQVRAGDAVGHTGSAASVAWTVDTTAPSVSITAGAPSFGFTSEAGATFRCALDGGAFTSCTSPTTYTGLADGSHTFRVEATDAAGNTSAPAIVTWTIATAATVFVSATGSDTNACSTRAAPCLSFQAAFDHAAPGAAVEVAGGTYASQTITGDRGGLVTLTPAAGATVAMGGTLFIEGAKHLKLVGFHFPRSDPTWELALEPCNDDITLANSTGRRFFILEGNSNITFAGGAWGGYATRDDEDSGIGTSGATGPTATCGGTPAPPAHNITFDGVTFHDVFWNAGCTDSSVVCTLPFAITCTTAVGTCTDGWASSHPDCLEVNGNVDGVLIENSTFVHCGNTMLSLYTDQGNIDNVVVRNNTFRDMAPTSYYGMQWTDTTAGFTCSGDKFLDNTYTPNAPGAWQANTPARFECNLAPGGVPTEVAGNTFQTGPSDLDCSRSKTNDPSYTPTHVYNTNWHGNTFTDATTACASP